MKTLAEIEPRTPVSSLPFTISAPGSYYLTGNLNGAPGVDGITVNASGVTLDLNGFTISSTGGLNASGNAIVLGASAPVENISIKNGSINGGTMVLPGGSFSGGGFNNGIHSLQQVNGIRVEDVSVSHVGASGIYLNQSTASGSLVVRNCTVRICGNTGITADAVSDCTATECASTGIKGITVINCRGEATLSHGITATTVTNCTGFSSSSHGIEAKIVTGSTGTTAGGPGGSGISAGDTAMNSSGIATASGTGLFSRMPMNCIGTSVGGTGLTAGFNAMNCHGISTTGTGLSSSYSAENCNGQTTSGAAGLNVTVNATNCSGSNGSGAAATTFGLTVGKTASNCFGIHGNSGVAVKGTILIGCTGFSSGATTFSFTNKYNMP